MTVMFNVPSGAAISSASRPFLEFYSRPPVRSYFGTAYWITFLFLYVSSAPAKPAFEPSISLANLGRQRVRLIDTEMWHVESGPSVRRTAHYSTSTTDRYFNLVSSGYAQKS